MTDRALSPPRPCGRRTTKRSRNGCLSCKKRKIKCDESQPECENCTRAGRQCDRYSGRDERVKPIVRFNGSKGLLFTYPALASKGDLLEERAFSFYLSSAAPHLSGYFDSAFWCSLIPRMARSNPIIWDGVLAISILYEHPQWSNGRRAELPDHDIARDHQRVALKFYNRAIFHIRNQTTHTIDDISNALMSCIIFICIEFLQDSTDQLPVLYEAGYKLLHANPIALDRLDNSLVGPADIRQVILPMFSRLSGLASLAGGPKPAVSPMSNTDCLLGTTTVAEARCKFYPLLMYAYGCISAASQYLLRDEDDPMDRKRIASDRDTAHSAFVEFYHAFLQIFERQDLSIQERAGVHTFLMHCELLAIWLPLCLERDEMCWDRYFFNFDEIVKRGKFVVQANAQRSIKGPQTAFVFDEGIIAPLTFTATHCRHPIIRREALTLLKQAPAKEGIWKAISAIHDTLHIIEIEEQGLEKSSIIWDGRGKGLETAGDELVQLPEEESRVHGMHVGSTRDETGQRPGV